MWASGCRSSCRELPMTNPNLPAHRIVLCRGEFCNLGRRADILHKRLQEAVNEANTACATPCVSLRTANCLSMCGAGPNMVVHPEDDVYNRLDPATLEGVIEKYVKP